MAEQAGKDIAVEIDQDDMVALGREMLAGSGSMPGDAG